MMVVVVPASWKSTCLQVRVEVRCECGDHTEKTNKMKFHANGTFALIKFS